MQVYSWLFRFAATSHLFWAMFLFLTDAQGRWGYQNLQARAARRHFDDEGYLSDPSAALASRITYRQLSAADRQVAVGFVVLAQVLQSSDPVTPSGAKAALIAMLWNGALVMNHNFLSAWYRRGELPTLTLQEWLFVAHSLVMFLFGAIYISHYCAHHAVSGAMSKARAIQEHRRKVQAVSSTQPTRNTTQPFIVPMASAPSASSGEADVTDVY